MTLGRSPLEPRGGSVKYHLSEVRKAVVGVVGFGLTVLATILAVGPALIPLAWLPWVMVALAVGSSYGIYQVPNQPAPGEVRKPGVSEVSDPVGGVGPEEVWPEATALSHLNDDDDPSRSQ
jgi:hypothetical protein